MQGPFEASCSHTRAPTKNKRCPIKTPNPRPQKWRRKTFTNQVPPKRASIVASSTEPPTPTSELIFSHKTKKKKIGDFFFWSAWRTKKWIRETCDYVPSYHPKLRLQNKTAKRFQFGPANFPFNPKLQLFFPLQSSYNYNSHSEGPLSHDFTGEGFKGRR